MTNSWSYINASTLNQFFVVFPAINVIPLERFYFLFLSLIGFFSSVIQILMMEKQQKSPKETLEIIQVFELKNHLSLDQTQSIIKKIICSDKNRPMQKFCSFVGTENPQILNVYLFSNIYFNQ